MQFNLSLIVSILLVVNMNAQIDTLNSQKELEEVVIVKKDPISEKFSVIKLNKLDVYFNPSSNGDVLKAITILPASTNIGESVNPTLRGGDADRSRIILNGVPILNPVRNGNNLGFGNFSLFNTEMIQKQYVYASNPPLTYGNSSAGLVEIETNKKIDLNQIQLSFGLANTGLLISKKFKNENFLQAYANYQFPNLFIELNKKNIGNLKFFGSKDIGLNTRINISEKSFWNSYHYFVDENFQVTAFQNNYSGEAKGNQKRYFTVNNLEFEVNKKSKIIYSALIDYTGKEYEFGVLNSVVESFQFFNSISNKRQLKESFSLQYGAEYSITNYKFNERKPIYYFNFDVNAPSYFLETQQNFQNTSGFFYGNWEISNQIGISSAVRSNIPLNNQDNYISCQFSTHYEPNKLHKLIFSTGKYHSYATPNSINHAINLLSSKQLALDYYFTKKKFNFSTAIYHKTDYGDSYFSTPQNISFNKVTSIGWEVGATAHLSKQLTFSVSNTILKQKIYLDKQSFTGTNNLNYFLKAQLTYNNFRLFTASLSYTSREGNYYTPVVNAIYNNSANDYEPIFSNVFNSNQLNNYNRVDFTINKVIPFLKKHGIIAYLSLNNIFNTKNQYSVYYNKNYTDIFYNPFQQRILYLGFQLRLSNL